MDRERVRRARLGHGLEQLNANIARLENVHKIILESMEVHYK